MKKIYSIHHKRNHRAWAESTTSPGTFETRDLISKGRTELQHMAASKPPPRPCEVEAKMSGTTPPPRENSGTNTLISRPQDGFPQTLPKGKLSQTTMRIYFQDDPLSLDVSRFGCALVPSPPCALPPPSSYLCLSPSTQPSWFTSASSVTF